MLSEETDVVVAASVGDGQMAVSRLSRQRDIDLVLLDVEMPVMDGLTALPKLLAIDPNIKVVMASTLTQRNAELSLRALQAGAVDCIPKPSSRALTSNADFRRELVAKVKALGAGCRRDPNGAPSRAEARLPPERGGDARSPASHARGVAPGASRFTLRAASSARPEVIAISCSTGRPQALC